MIRRDASRARSRAVVRCSPSGRPGGVAEHRPRHAELARGPGHRHREPVLAAAQRLGQHRRRVVGRARHQAQDGVLDRGSCRPPADRAWSAACPAARLETLMREDRSSWPAVTARKVRYSVIILVSDAGMTGFVGIARREHCPAAIVEQDRCLLPGAGSGAARWQRPAAGRERTTAAVRPSASFRSRAGRPACRRQPLRAGA